MQLHFTGRHLDITPALKTFAEKKMQRLKRRQNNITHINLIFQKERERYIAEATLRTAKFETHATAEATDLYAAIDELVDKLLGQITKQKEKHTEYR